MAESYQLVLLDGVLYFVDSHDGGKKKAVVPAHVRNRLLCESHSGVVAGHFAGNKFSRCCVIFGDGLGCIMM